MSEEDNNQRDFFSQYIIGRCFYCNDPIALRTVEDLMCVVRGIGMGICGTCHNERGGPMKKEETKKE